MLLSSTDQIPPNNPSSSSSFLHLTNSSDELGQSHLSRFSIRDYAFSYRSKNIKKSWPFSSTSLRLCLSHSLSDPLPPIQLLSSVITHPPQAITTHVQEAALSYKRNSEKLGFEKNGLSATTTTTSGTKSKTQVATVNKNPRKKIGLIVKPVGCVDSGSKEDLSSCLFAASESMALRTCPICKTFSSASNTTLNAHIDQCLSVDSEQQPISKPNKPRMVKPRLKVKTMVDIYAAAKGCTLEDLDKRNGTKWAVVSTRVVSDNMPEVSTNKGKKRSLLRVRADEDAAGIGPVYIDANGQKLRILSDPVKENEDVSEKNKSSREGKGNKSFRNRIRGKKYYKHLKLAPQIRKLTARKSNAPKILEHRRGYSEEGRGGVSKNGNKKGTEIRDEPSENGHSLSGDALVSRDPSTDLSETVSSSLNSQNSWRICGESQVSRRKNTKSASFVANPLRCSIPADKVFASEAKGYMKLKKARLDISEDEDEEDTGKWESEMTQEHELADWDRNGETNDFLLSSISGEDNDYESFEETGNNIGDDDMLDKTNDGADAEFESMIYEKTSCEQGSSFMEVDPIPIPGPPGSFLPSPWDMGTDAIGNSSVVTSQVQSSQDQLDRNSSESPVSAFSNFAAPTETHTLITIDKRPSRFRDNDKSCCCQRKEKAFEDATFGRPHMMINQDLDLLSKSVPAIPPNSNPVLRLMGKDLMVINQREETSSHGDLNLSKTPQFSPPFHHPFNTSTSFYNIP